MADFSLSSLNHYQQSQHQSAAPFVCYNSSRVSNKCTSTTEGRTAASAEEITYSRGFELWNHSQIQLNKAPTYDLQSSAGDSASESAAGAALLMRRGAFGGEGRGGLSCQDCGNQAKKDCSHLRCRTCCKTRGFHCPTHVKSTWVPVAKRRERQHQFASAAAMRRGSSSGYRPAAPTAPGEGSSGGGGEPSKRAREIATAAAAAAAHHQYGRGMEVTAGSFPPEVSQSAMFRCVRVSSVDEAHDEYAYQTAVNIGGHMFKGILYDHGPDVEYSPSSAANAPRYLNLHGHRHGHESSTSPTATAAATTANVANIGATIGANVGGGHDNNANVTTTTAALLDPYPTPLSAFMAGTQFFPHHPRH